LQYSGLSPSDDFIEDDIEYGLIPCLFPSGPLPVSISSSIALAGRFAAIEVWGRDEPVGRVVVDWLNAIEVCGRLYTDVGRLPDPKLFAKLLLETLRDGFEETEEVKEAFRSPVKDAPAPTRVVPLTVDRAPAMADLEGSPARSTKVFLFGSISLTKRIEAED